MSPGDLVVHTRDGHTEEELLETLRDLNTSFLRLLSGGTEGVALWKGMLLHGLGRFDEADDALTTALGADPLGYKSGSGATAYFRWRGYSRLCLGRLDEAWGDLHNAHSGQRVNAVDRMYRGMQNWLVGDDEAAVAQWRSGLELDESNPTIQLGLAWVFATHRHMRSRSGVRASHHVLKAECTVPWKGEMLRAVILAALGQFVLATRRAEGAAIAAPFAWREWCREQAARFEAGRPFHWESSRERVSLFLA